MVKSYVPIHLASLSLSNLSPTTKTLLVPPPKQQPFAGTRGHMPSKCGQHARGRAVWVLVRTLLSKTKHGVNYCELNPGIDAYSGPYIFSAKHHVSWWASWWSALFQCGHQNSLLCNAAMSLHSLLSLDRVCQDLVGMWHLLRADTDMRGYKGVDRYISRYIRHY